MDTRKKILPLETLPAALQTGDWIVVAGLFDPLTAVQAQRLAALANNGRKLLAIVLDGQDSLLSLDARALLVASLRDVSAVTSGNWRSLMPRTPRVEIVEDEAGEQARTAEFVEFVLNRQNG